MFSSEFCYSSRGILLHNVLWCGSKCAVLLRRFRYDFTMSWCSYFSSGKKRWAL